MNCASSVTDAVEYEIGSSGFAWFLIGTRLPPLGQPTSPMTILRFGYSRFISS